ncbi:hypothetical protein ACIGB8_28855 [Promicromonospora sukumoe]|uniref:hypothetical protein n=1 Tax=Promicromonospora sukumoe TaxID=88382 RepID=UPI0037C53141
MAADPAAPESPAPSAPARSAERASSSPAEEVRVEYPGITNWKPVQARVHPELHATFNTLVTERKRETGGGAREVMTDVLNAYLLTIPPFDPYTQRLHDRAEAQAAATKRRR